MIQRIKRAWNILFCKHFSGEGFDRNVYGEPLRTVYLCLDCGEVIEIHEMESDVKEIWLKQTIRRCLELLNVK